MAVAGEGVREGYLTAERFESIAQQGLSALDVDGLRVLVIVPDSTRTMPMPLVFDTLERTLGPRVTALDYLIALGTHLPMSDAQLSRHFGRPVVDGVADGRRVFNHVWDDPSTFAALGIIPAAEIAALSGGLLDQDVEVALNRLVLEYDHVLICGPVFPHEVVGFSGGTKYLFPGIAAAPIIHFTHWLGALMTCSSIIGTADTPVRAVIDRAAGLLGTPVSLLALVVTHHGIAGAYCGEPHEAWRQAAALSAHRHITWLERPVERVLAVMPPLYDDLWTAAKGTYKTEPAVVDGGEVIIYAPRLTEVSYVHGHLIERIGYHCRDYFTNQWERFRSMPWGILAHSTHVKGLGTYDAASGVETSRIRVTLATGIPEARCRQINLGYRDPATIDPATWAGAQDVPALVVPHAGEQLFRVGRPPGA
jgi:nickel-dependent lactate racemase